MKKQRTRFGLIAAVVSALLMPSARAAQKGFPIENRLTIIRDGNVEYQTQTQSFQFLVQVVSDDEGTKSERWENGRHAVAAKKNERYAVRLYNPLPVRVAVNLTVDGLNSLSGQPCGIADGMKWIVEPNSSVLIRGWQVNGGEARRFFFTDKRKSYAKWQGNQLDKNLSVNCGVIGAAYFWNKDELQAYYDQNPRYVCSPRPQTFWDAPWGVRSKNAAAPRAAADSLQAERGIDKAEEKAGTGMGERESHPTTMVDFHYDAGMYNLSQAVVIYYDFEKIVTPHPFPNTNFAPEM